MTLNAYFLEKPRCRRQVWLTGYCYPQNIQRTSATPVNELGRRRRPGVIASQLARWTRRPVSRVLCRRDRNPGIGDHSSGPPLAGRFSRPTRTAQAYDSPTLLRRGYAGRTVPIRSCSWRGLPCRPCRQARGGLLPTLSPFPLRRAEVCFLWRYPWGRPRRALPAAMSSWSPDFPRASCEARDRPAVWSARKVRVWPGEVKLRPL